MPRILLLALIVGAIGLVLAAVLHGLAVLIGRRTGYEKAAIAIGLVLGAVAALSFGSMLIQGYVSDLFLAPSSLAWEAVTFALSSATGVFYAAIFGIAATVMSRRDAQDDRPYDPRKA